MSTAASAPVDHADRVVMSNSRRKKLLLLLPILLLIAAGVGHVGYTALYRAKCGAISVKVQTIHRSIVQQIAMRHAQGRPAQHLLDVLVEDFPGLADGFYNSFCIEGSPRDAKIGQYTWADYQKGGVTQEELLAEAHRLAGSTPRWDRFGAHAFLITEEALPVDAKLLVSVGSVIHHRNPWKPLLAGFADEHVTTMWRDEFEERLEYLDALNLPRPPEDIWKGLFDGP